MQKFTVQCCHIICYITRYYQGQRKCGAAVFAVSYKSLLGLLTLGWELLEIEPGEGGVWESVGSQLDVMP